MKGIVNKIKKASLIEKLITLFFLIMLVMNLLLISNMRKSDNKYGSDVRYVCELLNDYHFDLGNINDKEIRLSRPLPILMDSANNKISLLISEYHKYLIYNKQINENSELIKIQNFYHEASEKVDDYTLLYNLSLLGNFISGSDTDKEINLSEAHNLMFNYVAFMLTSIILFIIAFAFIIDKLLISNNHKLRKKK